MLTKAFIVVLCFSFQDFTQGFDFTFLSTAPSGGANHNAGEVCGVLLCSERLADNPADTRKLAGLTVYKKVPDAGQQGEQWKQLATLTPQTPNEDGEEHISGELLDTQGHLRLELVKAEDCLSTQFSCSVIMLDADGQVTLMKSVVRAKIGSGVGPEVALPESHQTWASHAEESGIARQLDLLTTSLSEKLKCIETRLEDSLTRDNRLEDKLEDLKDSMSHEINSIEKSVGEKLHDSESRVANKIEYLNDRLEDKISDVSARELRDTPNPQISSDLCRNPGVVEGSLQSIEANFTSLGSQLYRVEAAVSTLVTAAYAMDNKLDNVVSSTASIPTLANNLTKSVSAPVSNTCVAGETRVAVPVEEYFDALDTGRRNWRLAFRGTAYNNIEIYPAYLYGTGIPAEVEAGCKQFNHSLPCINHYRNWDALENWADVDEILFAIYVKGRMVQNIIFNGRGSTYTNWFEANRVVVSTWTDMKSRTHNVFSIAGDGRSHIIRRFLVNHYYKNCNTDQGWFIAGDLAPGTCPWEKHVTRPAFLYATGKTAALWKSEDIARADSIGIYLKYR